MNIADGRQAFPAPAKLNLDLRITGRREDGYHNIESIFCLIDLQDTVYLKPRDDGKIILHNPVGGIPQEADLSYRAASLLQKYARNPAGVEIWLDKKIPTGAGLGGGSSDAATVLLVLNRWWQCGLTQRQLIDSGAALGADVPFFIFGKNAFARGIGDRLDEMDIPKQWYVIVKPPVHVSTAKIFTHEGLTRNSASSIMPKGVLILMVSTGGWYVQSKFAYEPFPSAFTANRPSAVKLRVCSDGCHRFSLF